MNEHKVWKVNRLYYHAKKLLEKPTEEKKIEAIDMTNELLLELEEQVKSGDIILININGKMRTGKSTLALKLGTIIFETLKKYHLQPKNAQFGIYNIARDQIELSIKQRDPELTNTVIVTDEFADLEDGGINSTVEKALLQQFSNVQAGRYIHGIFCSPTEFIDNNADIHIEVVSIDKPTCTTHARLYYRMFNAGIPVIQLLGHINICVEDIITNWETNIRPQFQANKLNDTQLLNAAKNDWYVEYVLRKYKKMELITRHGIFHWRELLYAELKLKVIKEQEQEIPITLAADKNSVRSSVQYIAREMKLPMSLLGEERETSSIMPTIQNILTIYKTNQQSIKNEYKYKKALDPKSKITYTKIEFEHEATRLGKTIALLQKKVKQDKERLQHLIAIRKEYDAYLTTDDTETNTPTMERTTITTNTAPTHG